MKVTLLLGCLYAYPRTCASNSLLLLLLLLFLDLGRWLVLELLSIDNTYPLLGSRKLTLVLQCLGRSMGKVSNLNRVPCLML